MVFRRVQNLTPDFIRGFMKLTHETTDAPREVGQAVGSKKQKDGGQYHHQFHRANSAPQESDLDHPALQTKTPADSRRGRSSYRRQR
jgi:hypothetical protein